MAPPPDRCRGSPFNLPSLRDQGAVVHHNILAHATSAEGQKRRFSPGLLGRKRTILITRTILDPQARLGSQNSACEARAERRFTAAIGGAADLEKLS